MASADDTATPIVDNSQTVDDVSASAPPLKIPASLWNNRRKMAYIAIGAQIFATILLFSMLSIFLYKPQRG